jgi:membrane protein
VARPVDRPAIRERFLSLVARLIGLPRAVRARRVLDRFGAADGGLLAAGVAYNAVLALIPLAILVSGMAGFVLRDPRSQADAVAGIVGLAPPLAGVIGEIVRGLATASPSLSLIGLLLAAWGTTRLFASLESGVAQMFVGRPRRGIVRRTARRIGSIVVLTGVLLAALVGAPALAIAGEIASTNGPLDLAVQLLLAVLPVVFTGLAVAAIYRYVPPIRPTWPAIGLPAVSGAIVLVVLTRLFVFLAPRVFGANFVYGALGAILVGLAWLNLVFTVILIGAAWVDARSEIREPTVV